jgi:glycosyltransferase involved in cell wall biosynthesis
MPPPRRRASGPADIRISCVMTTFEDGPLLRRAAATVLGQSHENLQLVLVDDGSGEETAQAVDEVAASDPRVLAIHQANAGLSAARNKGLEQIDGDYVCFLDADDMRAPWAFEAAAELIARDDPDLLFVRGLLSEITGDLRAFYDEGAFERLRELLGDRPAEAGGDDDPAARALAQLIEPQSANKFVRADFLRARRLAFPNTHFFEDMLFHTLALAQARRVSFLHAPGFAYFRRYRRPQITASKGDIRLDSVAVARLTLELFQRLPAFENPAWRGAVSVSVFRLLRWCENEVGHAHRWAFRELLKGAAAGLDPRYALIPDEAPAAPQTREAIRGYVREVFA